MTDTSEIVKQLHRESRHHTDVKAEAAQAIERLERDLDTVSTVHKNTIERRTKRAEKAERELAEARAREGRYREALDQAHAAMWDSYYGKGIAVEYARQVSEVVGEALAAPAPEPDWTNAQNEKELEVLLAEEPATTGEAERQYYRSCGNCQWQRDTDEDDRYEGRCPKCGGATLQWAKPLAAQQQEPSE